MNLLKTKQQQQKKNRNRLTALENKCVVTKGERWEREINWEFRDDI